MPNYAALATKRNELIRRARDGSVFIADASAPVLEELTDETGMLLPLPTGWKDLGYTSPDGVTFGRETESSEVRSFGSVEPTRVDITSDTITMSVTAQETSLTTIGLTTGVDPASLVPDPLTGELSVSKANLPAPRNYRLLGLFVDEVAEGEVYLARLMPRARITEFGETAYSSDGDDPVQYEMTFTGFVDNSVGYSHRWIFAGAGWKALLATMGFTTP